MYPELVVRDAQGAIQGVRYELAELKQANESMQAALLKLQAHPEQVAMR